MFHNIQQKQTTNKMKAIEVNTNNFRTEIEENTELIDVFENLLNINNIPYKMNVAETGSRYYNLIFEEGYSSIRVSNHSKVNKLTYTNPDFCINYEDLNSSENIIDYVIEHLFYNDGTIIYNENNEE